MLWSNGQHSILTNIDTSYEYAKKKAACGLLQIMPPYGIGIQWNSATFIYYLKFCQLDMINYSLIIHIIHIYDYMSYMRL